MKNVIILGCVLALTACGGQTDAPKTEAPRADAPKIAKPAATPIVQPKPKADYDFMRAPSEMGHRPGQPRVKNYSSSLVDPVKMKKSDYNTETAKVVGIEMGDTNTIIRAKIETFFGNEGYEAVTIDTTTRGGGIAATSDRLSDPNIRAYDVVITMNENQQADWVGMRQKCWSGPNKDVWHSGTCP